MNENEELQNREYCSKWTKTKEEKTKLGGINRSKNK